MGRVPTLRAAEVGSAWPPPIAPSPLPAPQVADELSDRMAAPPAMPWQHPYQTPSARDALGAAVVPAKPGHADARKRLGAQAVARAGADRSARASQLACLTERLGGQSGTYARAVHLAERLLGNAHVARLVRAQDGDQHDMAHILDHLCRALRAMSLGDVFEPTPERLRPEHVTLAACAARAHRAAWFVSVHNLGTPVCTRLLQLAHADPAIDRPILAELLGVCDRIARLRTPGLLAAEVSAQQALQWVAAEGSLGSRGSLWLQAIASCEARAGSRVASCCP